MGFIGKIFKFFTMRFVEGMFVVALILFMPSIPPYTEFSSFNVTPAQPLKGNLEINTRLDNAEKLFEGKIHGPEAFADYNGELYTGIHGGEVVKIKGDKFVRVAKFGEECNGFWEENKCGRPLGLTFDKNGDLVVADAYSGIWKVNVKSGKKTLLVSKDAEIGGKKSQLPNSVAVANNGDIYWTDSSSEFELRDGVYVILGDASGRLIKYDSSTKQNTILIDKVHFANGVALSDSEDFLLVNELMRSRILRYYLKGPKKGQHDVFLDGIPGLPDNLKNCGQGRFFVPLVLTRDDDNPALLYSVAPFPLIRKFVARLMGLAELGFKVLDDVYPNHYAKLGIHYIGHMEPATVLAPKRVSVLVVNNNGDIIESLHTSDGLISGISEAHVFGEHLYLGSPFNKYIARVPLTVAKLPKAVRIASSLPKPETVTKTPPTVKPTEAPKAVPTQTPPAAKPTPKPQQTTPPPPPKQTTPPPKQTAPPAKQTAPPVKQTTPPPKQTAPPVKQTTPPPKQTAPPAKQTTPPPKQTAPPTQTPTPSKQTPPPLKQTPPSPSQSGNVKPNTQTPPPQKQPTNSDKVKTQTSKESQPTKQNIPPVKKEPASKTGGSAENTRN